MSDMTVRARALVRAAKEQYQPTETDRERVLAALSARVDVQAVIATGAVSAASATRTPLLSRGSWLRVGGAGVAAVAVAVSYSAWRPSPVGERAVAVHLAVDGVGRTSSSAVEAEPPVASSPVASADEGGSALMAAPSTKAADPVRVPAKTAARAVTSSALAEEVALLSEAQSALNRGSASTALEPLRNHERKFPHGALAVERMALTAQALCALGRGGEADIYLARLASTHPNSPQVQQARAACARSGSSR